MRSGQPHIRVAKRGGDDLHASPHVATGSQPNDPGRSGRAYGYGGCDCVAETEGMARENTGKDITGSE
jgi:hypothetical protein